LTNEHFDLAELTCKKYENEDLVFQYDHEEDDCYYNTINSTELENAEILVSPNPFIDYIEIKSKEYKGEFEFELIGLTGKKILNKQFTTTNKIYLNNLEPGIYFYRLSINKKVFTGRIMKQ